MIEYSFFDSDVNEKLHNLKGETKNLSVGLFDIFQKVDYIKMKSSRIKIDLKKDLCIMILSTSNQESVNFKIDFFDGYYDFFVNDEEIVIQQQIAPIEKTLDFIYNHLISSVEEVLIEDNHKKNIKKQINFYVKGRKINSVSTNINISMISFLFKNKYKKVVKYIPWIVEPDRSDMRFH
ncbi:MAG: hypothetical protein RLZZ540_444 [Bacteroidota bacterium]|jgi:hypothetical protein